MILCGSFLAAAAFVWIFFRKKLSPEKKRMLGIVALAAGMGVFAGAGDGADSGLAEGNLLERKEYGAGSYEEQLTLSVGEDGEPFPYDVAVPEQILTTAEEQAFLAAAVEEIAREFPGENASVNHIEGAVAVRDSYQEEKVLATWSFDQPEIVNMQGKVIAEELPGEGVLVKAKAVLVCGESERTEEFYFRVFPLERSGTEEVLWQIEKDLKEQGTLAGETHLKLPETVDGNRLIWRGVKDRTPEKVLLLGIVMAVFVPLLEHSRAREKEERRQRLLELEYPELVSKIALLLGAGMTLQGALKKIAQTYGTKKKRGKEQELPAYEELLVLCREMENGMGEAAAYQRLGERCKNAEYRRLGTMLAQNLKMGSYGLVALLEQEAERAFEVRKASAKRYGEEAGTKLLFPMMLMLGLVIVVLMVPAVMAFQM